MGKRSEIKVGIYEYICIYDRIFTRFLVFFKFYNYQFLKRNFKRGRSS